MVETSWPRIEDTRGAASKRESRKAAGEWSEARLRPVPPRETGRKALESDQGEIGLAIMSERESDTRSSKVLAASLMNEGGHVRRL